MKLKIEKMPDNHPVRQAVLIVTTIQTRLMACFKRNRVCSAYWFLIRNRSGEKVYVVFDWGEPALIK
jgi:hypothetical protein